MLSISMISIGIAKRQFAKCVASNWRQYYSTTIYTISSFYLNSKCKQDRWFHVVVDWRSVDSAHLLCGDRHVQFHARPSIGWPICRALRGREFTLKNFVNENGKMHRWLRQCLESSLRSLQAININLSIYFHVLSQSAKKLFIATLIRWNLCIN